MKGAPLVLALALGRASLGIGQTTPQARLLDLGAVEAPGSVPVFYVASAKERALRFQSSLEKAHAWYERQINMKVPILLAVADSTMWQKLGDLYAWMYYPPRPGPKLVLVRDQPQANAPSDADPDHAKGGLLNNEHVLFHDDGHILGDAAHIKTGNKSVDELVASLFMTKYILAERPDLTWVANASHTVPAPTPLQYTSLADLDYLDDTGEISAQNAYWYLRQMVSVIARLSRDETFPAVIAKFQKAFPAPAKRETPEEINNRLESIWPGFRKTAGSLAGPSTIQRTTPTACAEVSEGNGTARVVIQNNAANPLAVTIANDRFMIPDHSWKTFSIKRNQSIRFSDGTCLVGGERPTIALVGTK